MSSMVLPPSGSRADSREGRSRALTLQQGGPSEGEAGPGGVRSGPPSRVCGRLCSQTFLPSRLLHFSVKGVWGWDQHAGQALLWTEPRRAGGSGESWLVDRNCVLGRKSCRARAERWPGFRKRHEDSAGCPGRHTLVPEGGAGGGSPLCCPCPQCCRHGPLSSRVLFCYPHSPVLKPHTQTGDPASAELCSQTN